MINKELLQLTLDTIKANPQHWNQRKWHCGTTHCFAGIAYLLGMNLPLTTDEYDLGKDTVMQTKTNSTFLLGLTDYQAGILFSQNNTLQDLEHMVYVLINTDVTGLDGAEYYSYMKAIYGDDYRTIACMRMS